MRGECQHGEDNGEEQHMNVAFKENAFYQMNAIGYQGFKSTKVLLDNQVNILIIFPS
jgi:hypothetical protein